MSDVGGNVQIPETQYTESGGAFVAYQAVGDGPVDLVMVREPYGVDLVWDLPDSAYFHRRLATGHRLILFDARGFGSSDRGGRPSWEMWADDLIAVLDAVGSERAVVLATGLAGMIGLLCAATHPDRATALILVNSYARWFRDTDYPHGYPLETRERIRSHILASYGTRAYSQMWAPSWADEEDTLAQFTRALRLSISRGQVLDGVDPNIDRDARPVLGAIRQPTLVMHRAEDRIVGVGNGRYLAEHIDGAEYLELPGEDHMYFAGDVDPMLARVESFIARAPSSHAEGRVLATILITDIVGSTALAASIGDARWRALLDQHDGIARSRMKRDRGRYIKSTGDGLLATFDGPARAIRSALALREDLRTLGLEVRAGVHCAEVELRGRDIGGIGVHLAARIVECAGPGEVLVSSTVRDLVAGADVDLTDHGERELKGIPDVVRLYAAAAATE